MSTKHLFLLIPPRGGSNFLFNNLARCKNISTLDLDEGEKYFCDVPTYLNSWSPVSCIHGFASRRIEFYDDDNRYNWDRIKEVWKKDWIKNIKENASEPIFIEKSPPNIFRFSLLNKYFPNSYFIAMLRNPYTQIEAWSRHFSGGQRGNVLHDLYVDWIRHAEYVKMAIENLKKDRIIFINYEDVVHSPTLVEEKIINFIPELHDFKISGIIDNNAASLSRLTYTDINMINDAMTDNTMFTMERIKRDRSLNILKYFDYDMFSNIRLLSDKEYLFFDKKYVPLWKNSKFVEYYTIGQDGLINHELPSWMLFFGLAKKKLYSMYYNKWRKI